MPELPRLDDLVGLADVAGDDRDGVLDGDLFDGCIHEQAHEGEGLRLFLALLVEPPRPAHGEVSAWRVSDHQIPAHVQHLAHVPAPVRPGLLAGQQVARHGIVTPFDKRIAHGGAVLAGNEHFHAVTPRP
jgi:hypothetical protein